MCVTVFDIFITRVKRHGGACIVNVTLNKIAAEITYVLHRYIRYKHMVSSINFNVTGKINPKGFFYLTPQKTIYLHSTTINNAISSQCMFSLMGPVITVIALQEQCYMAT